MRRCVDLGTGLHPFERLGYVLSLLRGSGAYANLGTETLRGRPRPWNDAHAQTLRHSDPLFLAEATRKA